MKVAVIQFPGSNCDQDAFHAYKSVLGQDTELVWHKRDTLAGFDLVIVPGGFSYGDYLRCGAIARFSPIMQAVRKHAEAGGAVVGICNGFQILCEARLLPGALIRNDCLEFRCQTHRLLVEDSNNVFNQARLGKELLIPIAHGEGNYQIDPKGLEALEAGRQVILRYAEPSPNGSVNHIAGIRNQQGNVVGMMPHPERACEDIHPSTEGLKLLRAFGSLSKEVARVAV